MLIAKNNSYIVSFVFVVFVVKACSDYVVHHKKNT